MNKHRRNLFSVVLIISILLFPFSALAQDVEETVKAQIEYTKQRMSEHKQELSGIFSQFAKNPSSELYTRIQELQRNIAKESNVLNSLGIALRDAQASKSWWSMVEDMSKESTLIAAGAGVVSGVYDAGKWIFGPTQEDIFGEGWDQVESFNAKLVNEARMIREESRSIASGLTQIDSLISSGTNPEALNKLRDDMVKRLRELQERKEVVRKNLRFLIRLYRAEKENLPAASVFWGEDYMGRYVKVMQESVNIGNLADYAWDLVKGNMVKPLAKFIKPMVQVAIGDYLAKARGGNQLTPQIIDDLTFSILFSSSGKNLEKFATDKIKSEVTGKVLQVTAQGMIEAEAQVLFGTAQKTMWELAKKEISNLPVNADFTNQTAVIVKSTENLAKQAENTIRYNALGKLDKAVKTGKVIKDIWDVVLKDAVQVYLVSDEFTATIKAANEACAGYRQQWQKMKDDMILTENEYVNSKWFSQSRAPAQAPKGAVDPLAANREQLSKADPEATGKLYNEFEKAVETYGGKEGVPASDPGNMDLAELASIEDEMFRMVLEGKLPADKIMLANFYNLTAKKMYTPCYEQTAKDVAAFNRSWPEEKCRFREEIAACNASAECRAQNLADPQRWWRKQDQCRKERNQAYINQVSKPQEQCVKDVNAKYLQFVNRRAQNIQNLYKMLEEQYKKTIDQGKAIAGPAIDWMQSYAGQFDALTELGNNKELIQASWMDLSILRMPPDLPATVPLGGLQINPQEYELAKVKDLIANINKALKFVPEIERLKEPLEKADFIIEEIAGFLNENPWLKTHDANGMPVTAPVVYKTAKPSAAAENNSFGTGPGIYTAIGAAESMVTLSDPQEVISNQERELFFKILYRNPNAYKDMLDKLLAIPVVAGSNYYRTLSDFSPDKAYSLYSAAVSAYNNAVSQGNQVNNRFAEAEQIYRRGSNVEAIARFYESNFRQWVMLRKAQPASAAKVLGKDTEQFEELVLNFEKQMQVARAQVILPDVDSLKREIDKFNEAAKSYRQSFESYYQYLAQYFKDREYPLFDMPDISYPKMRADNIQINSDEYSYNFKKASDGLKEMKAVVDDFKNADKSYLIALSQASAQKSRFVEEFMAFYRGNPDRPDECLKKLEQVRKDVQNVVVPADYQYDHNMPKKIKDEALRMRMADYLGKLIPIEEELQKKKNKENVRQSFTAYQIQNARLNTYSLANASGDVTLLRGDLKQGEVEIQGWFPHLDRVAKILFSEDGGRTWKELAKDQAFTVSFTPMPDKLYEPLIKLQTDDFDEFQIKVFPNIRGIIFRDEDYEKLVAETIKKIAEAYETQNIGLFSEYISRDYLGNKTFLEDGVRFDFDMFINIRLSIYINRIEKRVNTFIAETKWDKTQTPRKTGQEQRTSGNTTFMFVLEDGKMKIKNLRGNLLYATLSPEIAQASGLSSTVISEIRTARDDRNPTQPGASTTEDSGGLTSSTTALTVTNSPVVNTTIGFDFTANNDVVAYGADSDLDFEGGLIWGGQVQEVAQTFSGLTEAPASGYTSGPLTNAEGKVFAFMTKESYYGKMEVLTLTDLGGGNYSVTFKFAIQTDLTRNLQTQ